MLYTHRFSSRSLSFPTSVPAICPSRSPSQDPALSLSVNSVPSVVNPPPFLFSPTYNRKFGPTPSHVVNYP